MTNLAELIRDGSLGIMRIDNLPVNAISPELVAAISRRSTILIVRQRR